MQPHDFDALKDIHIPNTFDYWFPPAIGWWIVIILTSVSSYFLIALYQNVTRKTVIKMAKQHFLTIKNHSEKTPLEKISDISALMRYVAISYYPRADVAGLTGFQWLHFLDESFEDAPFCEGIGRILIELPYYKEFPQNIDFDTLLSLCERWFQVQKFNKKLNAIS